MPLSTRSAWLALACVFASTSVAQNRPSYEGEPLHYEKPAHDGPVERLARLLESGKVKLDYDDERGFLMSLLKALDIPVSSQVLVFSKTSFQHQHIAPERPRAVYFGDEAYVGWVPGAPLLEITSMDAKRGAVFYSLEQRRPVKGRLQPRFERRSECMSCHVAHSTHGWPGHRIRSVHLTANGQPSYQLGTFETTHSSPFAERWGGWYVSGKHGKQRHLGNSVAKDENTKIDPEPGANVTDLSRFFDTKRYPTPHSDIVALMVLEHQAQAHNAIQRARCEATLALYREKQRLELIDRKDIVRQETDRRLRRLARELIDVLLMKDEARLKGRVEGTSSFSKDFVKRGPRDRRGRSLRELDLKRRLFRYSCSYVIYSPTFDALPERLRRIVSRELVAVLGAKSTADRYRHLSKNRRRVILEILRETKPALFR